MKRPWIPLLFSVLLFGPPPAASPALGVQEDLGTGRVAGRVVDEAGTPIAGAEVTAASLRSATKLSATTDSKGNFAIAGFGTGPWRFSAAKPGYIGTPVDLQVRQLARNPAVSLVLKKTDTVPVVVADEAARQDFEEANRLALEGRFGEALTLYQGILKKYPEVYQVQLNAGLCQLQLGKVDEAKAYFQTTLELIAGNDGNFERDHGASGKAMIGLGEAEMRSGDLLAAMDHFRQAFDLSPNDETVAYNIGEILFAGQRVDEAIGYFELALRIKKDWTRPLFRLGLAYLNKGDYDAALGFLNRFIETDPANPLVPQARGMIESIQKLKK